MTGRLTSRVGAMCYSVVGVWLALGFAIPRNPDSGDRRFPPAVPRFEIARSPIEVRRAVRPLSPLAVVGRRAACLGTEAGTLEFRARPVGALHDLRLEFRRPGGDGDGSWAGARLARDIVVRPELTTIIYSGPSFTVQQHILVPLDEPAVLLLLDVEAEGPLEVAVSFRVGSDPAPGGRPVGRQSVRWQETRRRFLLASSGDERAVLIGSPWATVGSGDFPNSSRPRSFRIPIETDRARSEFVPIAIAARDGSGRPAADVYRRLLDDAAALYGERRDHARRIREELASVSLPDSSLHLAVEWAKVNLDGALACHSESVCGLVSSYGSVRRSDPPRFSVPAVDASLQATAAASIGLDRVNRTAIESQRENATRAGAIPHVVAYDGDRPVEARGEPAATALWALALYEHWLQTGDPSLIRASWPIVGDLHIWGRENDRDADGIPESVSGLPFGSVAVEPVEERHQDLHVAALWVESLRGISHMAGSFEDYRFARQVAQTAERGWSAIERRYYSDASGRYAFRLLADGTALHSAAAWPAIPMAFGLLDSRRANADLDLLASAPLAIQWGPRTAAPEETGTVAETDGAIHPILAGFIAWATFNYHRPHAGYAALLATARSTRSDAGGEWAGDRSNGVTTRAEWAVPYDATTSGVIINAMFRGMLGLRPDASRRALTFAPHLPADLDGFSLRNYPIGAARLEAQLQTRAAGEAGTDGHTTLWAVFRRAGPGPQLRLRFAPALPPGSRVLAVRVNDEEWEYERIADAEDVHPAVTIRLDRVATVAIDFRAGLSVVPPRADASGLGAPPVRVVRYRFDEGRNEYVLRVEGPADEDEHSIELISPRGPPVGLSEGTVHHIGGDRFRLAIPFEDGRTDRIQKVITFSEP